MPAGRCCNSDRRTPGCCGTVSIRLVRLVGADVAEQPVNPRSPAEAGMLAAALALKAELKLGAAAWDAGGAALLPKLKGSALGWEVTAAGALLATALPKPTPPPPPPNRGADGAGNDCAGVAAAGCGVEVPAPKAVCEAGAAAPKPPCELAAGGKVGVLPKEEVAGREKEGAEAAAAVWPKGVDPKRLPAELEPKLNPALLPAGLPKGVAEEGVPKVGVEAATPPPKPVEDAAPGVANQSTRESRHARLRRRMQLSTRSEERGRGCLSTLSSHVEIILSITGLRRTE